MRRQASPEYHRKRRADRKRAGLCSRCSNPRAEWSAAFCEPCLIKHREYERKRHEKKALSEAVEAALVSQLARTIQIK